MNSRELALLSEAEVLGSELTVGLANEIASSKNPGHLLHAIAPASRRESLLALFRKWDLPVEAFGVALLAASIAADRRRKEFVEVVWTGPDSQVIPVRKTEQVLLELIRGARQRLLLVSYAVYRIPRITRALVDAAARGVYLRVVLDIADPSAIVGYNPLMAIGEVADCAEILYWPEAHRVLGLGQKRGTLHVKCVVADRERMFVSSANLTEQALSINMELGVLITGTQHPASVDDHFSALASLGVLKILEA